MSMMHIQVEGVINAPTSEVYNLLADYRNGHPLVLPKPYFSPLVVEQGGVGAGTIISFSVTTGGVTRHNRSLVSEPQPGRVLVETDTAANVVTTFTFTPQGDDQCVLQIATDMATSKGFRGWVEKMFAPGVMRPIYQKELRQIDEVARQRHAATVASS